VRLTETQTALVDCSNGGTTVNLGGNGASYLIVPEFPTNQVADQLFPYSVATGDVAAAAASSQRLASWRIANQTAASRASAGRLPPMRPLQLQQAFDGALRARARQQAASFSGRSSLLRSMPAPRPSAAIQVPAVGSTRSFHVLSSFNLTSPTWATVTAQLAYAGSNVLLYIDQASPANGFTPTQLQAFGQLFDQTLYPIDTLNFGQPSDVDANGHAIMLLSPVVNALTPSAQCGTLGYIAGFFDSEDFNGPADPNSNQGEILYSIVPDPSGTVSCAHSVADLDAGVPATFLHELQHLIDFSQHVVVNGGNTESGWLDEGLSIVAEELGSLYYEQKCPPPSCRTDPSQLFPDSSQGFVQSFLYDSYQFALLPDTASLTLHDDSENGFSWRGGDWLLMRWLGDQMGPGFYRQLEQGSSDGITDIAGAAGQSFPSLFANFGLALYTDSLPGLPRATAPAIDRLTTRNLRALWARLYATSGGTTDIPFVFPLLVFPITTDTTSAYIDPGTLTYFRLDTPASDTAVTIRFSGPGGNALSPLLHPQLSIFRLPAGQ
jgi:hypothetical protein